MEAAYKNIHPPGEGVYFYAKQKQPNCKKGQGQSEATMVISDQKL